MLPVFAGVTAADEWGRPDNYATGAFLQKYGKIGSDINVSTLTESLKITLTADKKTFDSGKITFTLNVRGGEEGLAVNAVGVIPVYNTYILSAVSEGAPETADSRLIGGFSFEKKPVLEASKWTENMDAYAVAAAWRSTDPLYIPENTNRDFYSFSLMPKNNAKGPSEIQAYVTFKYGELEFSRLVGITIGGNDRRITSASVTVGNDLTLKVKAVLGELTEAPYMLFNVEGTGSRIVFGTFRNGFWEFDFDGIGYEQMTDKIGFTLFANGAAVDSRNGFTIKNYAEVLLGSGADDDAKVLAGRMLMYGAEVQKALGYKTDRLATEGVGELSDEELFKEIEAPERRGGKNEGEEATVIKGSTFDLLGGFEFGFDVAAAGEEIRVSYEETGEELDFTVSEGEENATVTTASVGILGIDKMIVFENGGGNTVLMSGADYIVEVWDSETEGELAKALYALCLAALQCKGLGG